MTVHELKKLLENVDPSLNVFIECRLYHTESGRPLDFIDTDKAVVMDLDTENGSERALCILT